MDALTQRWILLNKNGKTMVVGFSNDWCLMCCSPISISQIFSIAYSEMNEFNQEQTLRQNFDQLILNIRTYLLIVENISNSFDGRMGWKEFKFCFKLATSQVVSYQVALVPPNGWRLKVYIYTCC